MAGIKITSTLTFNDVLERTLPAASTSATDEDYEHDTFEAEEKKPHSVTFSGLQDTVAGGSRCT